MTSQLAAEKAGEETAAGLTAGRGRGPGGQPMAVLLPAGRCPLAGCAEKIDPSRLMCRRHWYRVPKRLRDQVWATWRSGHGALSAAHQEAVLAAIRGARNAGTGPPGMILPPLPPAAAAR